MYCTVLVQYIGVHLINDRARGESMPNVQQQSSPFLAEYHGSRPYLPSGSHDGSDWGGGVVEIIPSTLFFFFLARPVSFSIQNGAHKIRIIRGKIFFFFWIGSHVSGGDAEICMCKVFRFYSPSWDSHSKQSHLLSLRYPLSSSPPSRLKGALADGRWSSYVLYVSKSFTHPVNDEIRRYRYAALAAPPIFLCLQ